MIKINWKLYAIFIALYIFYLTIFLLISYGFSECDNKEIRDSYKNPSSFSKVLISFSVITYILLFIISTLLIHQLSKTHICF